MEQYCNFSELKEKTLPMDDKDIKKLALETIPTPFQTSPQFHTAYPQQRLP
jgi:hypothetical protein